MTITTLPRERALTNNALIVWSEHRSIHGLIEVDVTNARRRLRDLRDDTGESLSMTAFVIHCFALAVSREPRLNSLVRGRTLYSFDAVNVATMVERERGGEKIVSAVNIRDAQTKSVRDIHEEIRHAQTEPLASAGDAAKWRWLLWLPGWVLRLVLRFVQRRPALVHRMGGVTGVTAVGMFASGIGWGLPITPNTVMLTVGGIGARPAIDAGQLVDREVLCLTITVDHDVVDGAPAARFASQLKALLRDAAGLEPSEPREEPTRT